MRVLLRIVAIATVLAWLSLHAAAAAAQTFDDRWSIIPNAHAEPASPPPPAGPAPATPEEKKPDTQAGPDIGGESAHSLEEHSAKQSSNRVFSGKASFYSYQTGKTASGSTFNRNLPTLRTAACRSAREFALLTLRPIDRS